MYTGLDGKNPKLLIVSIVIPQLVGILSSYYTISAIPTWYATLNKASFNPPNFIFGPVWTILYLLMGISLYLVLVKKVKLNSLAVKMFSLQLFLNFMWTFIFFGLKNPALAYIEMVVFWLSIFFTIKLFHKISKNAAYLLFPYLLWVSFASLLNLSVILLNP